MAADAREVPADNDDLIVLRPQGLYCPAGDFFIELAMLPLMPVTTT